MNVNERAPKRCRIFASETGKRYSPPTHLQEKGLVTTGMRVQDSTEPQGPDGREHLKPVATRASGHGMPCPYKNNSLTSNKILNILITVLTAIAATFGVTSCMQTNGKAKRREMSGVVSAPPRSIEAMRSTSFFNALKCTKCKVGDV